MIFHVSIAADDPHATAQFLATLWEGRALPFPPFAQGSWIAMAGDDRNSAIEVYPRGAQMHHGGAEASEVQCHMGDLAREQPGHAAIATSLSTETVLMLAGEAGVPARVCDRGPFHVIELWIDGCVMFEALTPEFQAEYLRTMNCEGFEAFLAAASGQVAA